MKFYIEYYKIKFELLIIKMRLHAIYLDMAIDRFLIRILFELKIIENTYAYNKNTKKHYNLKYAEELNKIYSRKYNR